ncbi:MAG TPA: hypothetical protein VJS63_09110 [Bradyrhizobium sp.]|nr:hypothetical protein [Bradyrhizobium sp.]
MRLILAREAPTMPLRLQLLLDRLAEQDLPSAPSIAPCVDDMVWQSERQADPRLMDAA